MGDYEEFSFDNYDCEEGFCSQYIDSDYEYGLGDLWGDVDEEETICRTTTNITTYVTTLSEKNCDKERGNQKMNDDYCAKKKLELFEKKLGKLKDLVEIQNSSGNYNYSEYMLGLANGLILAESVISDSAVVEYLDVPEKWLSNECEFAKTIQKHSFEKILDNLEARKGVEKYRKIENVWKDLTSFITKKVDEFFDLKFKAPSKDDGKGNDNSAIMFGDKSI